jgi:DNA-binding XRE family transcriptional regulator
MPRKNTSSADYPQAVLREIERLAQNITIARKRRGESQAQWARKLGISQPTMGRIERGDPSVAMASYVMCMWLINQGGGLADLIAPQNDHAALEKEVAKVHSPRKLGQQGRAGLPAAQWNSAPIASQNAAVAERPESAPPATTGRRKPSAGASRLSDLPRQDPAAMSDVRKSLASATRQSDLASSSTASGLAALLAGSERKTR